MRSTAAKIARLTAGFAVLLAGVLMLLLPGPGWLTIVAGLAILRRDVAWADRALVAVRRRVPGLPDDGRVPRSALVVAGVAGAAGLAAGWVLL